VTQAEFADLLVKIQETEREVRASAQQEYAHEGNNAFRNFDLVGEIVRCPHCNRPIGPMATLLVYLLKHIFGIVAWVGGARAQREDVTGRILDSRLYEALLWGIVKREERQSPHE